MGGRGDRQHIGMPFLPRGVGDLGHDAVQGASIGLVAVIEADRIEHMPGKAQVGKKAHRAGRPEAEGGRGVVADCIGQWPRGITEVVAAAEFGQVAPIDRPQPAASEHRIELVQVEQQLRDRVTERMRVRVMPPVHHLPEIERAGAHAATSPAAGSSRCGSQARSASTTRRALRSPSS
ncbi:hypothetical protein G6F46_013478 [Rhizopus delemar]|nr:hypothetical protein G6F46_013478 [Rhizopus delemar]